MHYPQSGGLFRSMPAAGGGGAGATEAITTRFRLKYPTYLRFDRCVALCHESCAPSGLRGGVGQEEPEWTGRVSFVVPDFIVMIFPLLFSSLVSASRHSLGTPSHAFPWTVACGAPLCPCLG